MGVMRLLSLIIHLLAPNFRNISNRKHSEHMENCRRDDQQIRLESVKTKAFQRQRQILIWRGLWNLKQQTEDIERPQIIVRHALP